MASIAQKSLFCWEDIDELGDLKRLELVLTHIDDEELMVKLEKERGLRGRRDYPIRAVWNSLIAKVTFQHKSIESLRRELSRNAQLRQMCGFNPAYGESCSEAMGVYQVSKEVDEVPGHDRRDHREAGPRTEGSSPWV